MTGIIRFIIWNDYAERGWSRWRFWFIFLTHIIFGSLPSHSATSLGAVLLFVQCVCYPADFLVFLCSGLFLFSRILKFLENQGCDIASVLTRLTFWSGCHDKTTSKDLSCPLVAHPHNICFIFKKETWSRAWVPSHLLLFTFISLEKRPDRFELFILCLKK